MTQQIKDRKNYTRRTNSNGEDVAPTLTASIAKGVQNQLDFGGGYVIEHYKKHSSTKKKIIHCSFCFELFSGECEEVCGCLAARKAHEWFVYKKVN